MSAFHSFHDFFCMAMFYKMVVEGKGFMERYIAFFQTRSAWRISLLMFLSGPKKRSRCLLGLLLLSVVVVLKWFRVVAAAAVVVVVTLKYEENDDDALHVVNDDWKEESSWNCSNPAGSWLHSSLPNYYYFQYLSTAL